MFYCQPCGKEKEWPESLAQSQGRCEICGKTAICNDVPSRDLPPSPRAKALGELATAYGAVALSLVPDPVALVRLTLAKSACQDAGMTVPEIDEALVSFQDAAQEAIQKTFS